MHGDVGWTPEDRIATATANGTSVVDIAGVELGSGSPSGIPRWDGTGSLDWRYRRRDAPAWLVRAFGPMTEACTDRYAGTPLSCAGARTVLGAGPDELEAVAPSVTIRKLRGARNSHRHARPGRISSVSIFRVGREWDGGATSRGARGRHGKPKPAKRM